MAGFPLVNVGSDRWRMGRRNRVCNTSSVKRPPDYHVHKDLMMYRTHQGLGVSIDSIRFDSRLQYHTVVYSTLYLPPYSTINRSVLETMHMTSD